jgi:hypothetical protein
MYVKIMICVSMTALAVALFMTSNASYRVLLQFLVCASAALIVLQAVRAEAQYLWAGAFCIVAVLFNPILPIALPIRAFFLVDLTCMALFLVYYSAYKATPRPSMVSVTDRSPGSGGL